jgi:hypothetical protein
MDTHITRKPKPDPIRLDYLLTEPESELVEAFRSMTEADRLELLAVAMRMQRKG